MISVNQTKIELRGWGKNASSADNQQGSLPMYRDDPSETTRRAPYSQNEIKAYFLGALHDGTFSSNQRFRISQKGTSWLKILKNLLSFMGYTSWIYREGKKRKIYVLETLADFLDFTFDPLKLKSNQEKIGYIRGFFDAEGGIPKNNKSRFYIQLTQRNKQKIEKLKEILKSLGIKTGKIHNPSRAVDPYYWRIYVRAESQRLFINMVSSWHPRKMKTLSLRMKI